MEFIEASLGVVESSFQLGLRFCGMGGLKDNVTKSDHGVVEGRVLHVYTGRRAQSQPRGRLGENKEVKGKTSL